MPLDDVSLAARAEAGRAPGHPELARVDLDTLGRVGDPARPEFIRLEHNRATRGARKVDYDFVGIDATMSYLIAGVRGSSAHFDCSVYGPDTKGNDRIVANVSDDDVTLGSRGEFALYLATLPPPPQLRSAQWIRLTNDASAVIIRQCFDDRSTETPARFDVVCMAPRRFLGPATG